MFRLDETSTTCYLLIIALCCLASGNLDNQQSFQANMTNLADNQKISYANSPKMLQQHYMPCFAAEILSTYVLGRCSGPPVAVVSVLECVTGLAVQAAELAAALAAEAK